VAVLSPTIIAAPYIQLGAAINRGMHGQG